MTDLQVIGAGLGRTGTWSMKLALEELGFNPCHHMREIVIHPERTNYKAHFNSILLEENSVEAMKAIFGGYKATVDYPGCLFYEEFMKLNPHAKVVLTVRDSSEAWVKSVSDTNFSMNTASNWFSWKLQETMVRMVVPDHFLVIMKILASQKGHGVNPFDPKTDLVQMYTDWINRVKETVPADKLLVFNVKKGWKPLCDFLGVPVPDKPFPRTNNTKEWQDRNWSASRNRTKKALLKIVIVVGLLGTGVYLFNLLAFYF